MNGLVGLVSEWNQPRVDPSAWIAPNATVVGRVSVGAGSSIWYTAVLRADLESIGVGDNTNVQDGAVVHADPGFPVRVGDRVTIGHRAILHGCTIEDGALIGMGAIVMNGAIIGVGSMVGAGAVVLEGTRVPPNSLVVGSPSRVVRELTGDEQASVLKNVRRYCHLAGQHAALFTRESCKPLD